MENLFQKLLSGIVKTTPNLSMPATPTEEALPTFLADIRKKAEANQSALLNKSPFLSAIGTDVKDVAKRATSAVGRFAKQQVENVADAATGKLGATGEDYKTGARKVLSGIGRGAQMVNEGTISFGKSLMQGLVGKDVIDQIDTTSASDPISTAFLKNLTGVEDVATAQDFLPAFNDYAVSRGATPEQAKVFSGIGFVGLMAANSPGFSSGKAAFKLTKEGLESIARTEEKSLIKDILVKEGLDEKTAERISPAFTYANTPEQVSSVVEDIKNGVKIVDEASQANPDLSVRLRERGFGRTVDDVAPEQGVTPESYAQRNTDQLAIKAQNLVRDDIAAAELRAASTELSDDVVATAAELLKYYRKQSLESTEQAVRDVFDTKFAELTRDISRKLTEAGRYSQAASIMRRQTPEGKIRFAIQQIQKNNLKASGKKLPELTEKEIVKIKETYDKVDKMPEGLDKDMAFAKAEAELAQRISAPSWYKKLVSLWKAGLLTGLRTSGLNIASTSVNTGLEALSKIPGAGVDIVTSLITGARALTSPVTMARKINNFLKTGKYDKEGMIEGVKKGWQYLKTGYDERKMRDLVQLSRTDYGDSPVGKALTAYVDSVFRLIGSEDFPFFYGARASSLYDQATAAAKNSGLKGKEYTQFIEDLMKSPTDEMLQNATADGLTATFSNNTLLGQIGVAIQEKIPGGEILVPFARTPGAVAMQVINYTPAGPVLEIAKQIQKGKFNQRANSRAWGRGITGTGMMYLGYEAYKNGLVSLNRPETERTQKQAELENRPNNAIKIGDRWVNAAALGPFGLQMILGGYLARGMEETGSVSSAVMQTALGIGTTMSEQSMLQGLERFVKAIDDPAGFGPSYAESLIGSVIPTIISDVAQGIDPYERETPGIFDSFKARTPWLREGLQPQVNVLGGRIGMSKDEAATLKGQSKDLLKSMLDFTRSKKSKTSPLIEEFKRLEKAGFPSTPTKLGDKKGYDALTPEENTKLWLLTGIMVKTKLDKLIVHPKYQAMDDEQKNKAITKITNEAKDRARAQFISYLTAGMNSADLRQHLSAYKESGLLTKTVLDLWKTRQ